MAEEVPFGSGKMVHWKQLFAVPLAVPEAAQKRLAWKRPAKDRMFQEEDSQVHYTVLVVVGAAVEALGVE